MLMRQLDSHLHRAAVRIQTVRRCWFMAAGWTLLAVIGVVMLLPSVRDQGPAWSAALLMAGGALLTAGLAWLYARLQPLRRVDLAREIERRHPELDACLVTAVEQEPQFPNGRYGVLQEAVFRRALIHARRHPWDRSVSRGRLWKARLASVAALLLLSLVTASFLLGVRPGFASIRPPQAPPVAAETGVVTMTVEPGDVEVERGTPLIVLARFPEGAELPSETTLVWQAADGEPQRLAMTKSLDPVFGGRIAAVEAPLRYHVEYGETKSDRYSVSVFEYPRLDRADAELAFPEYTGREPRLVEDTRSVAAVEGAKVTWTCHLNKPVAEARLESQQGEVVPLAADPDDPAVVRAAWTVVRSGRYTLRLVDSEGRENQRPAELRVRALPNRPPQVKVVRPARDLEVSPLEEVPLAAQVSDDFGLLRYGLTVERPGLEPIEIPLGQDAAAGATHETQHLLELEALEVEPDQLLTYHFWAEDIDGAGQQRLTLSDMYFLEVRPFEEIFREGEAQSQSQQQQQQQQQQGGAAQQAEELAELQKQIINATWKVLRQRPEGGQLVEDAELLSSSQADAVEMATELGGELQDAESKQHLVDALEAMNLARSTLEAAADDGLARLGQALAPQRAAYQSLLRLRAREHEVVQQQQQQQQGQSSSSRSSSSRSQQQLQQLELDNQENRYETQRQAQSLQDPEQRETRQTLNRLRELAQRQEDVNKRVKELQAALEEAETQEERDELQRQLKRLRDEQQQVLRDVDELQNRTQDSQSETAEQLQQQLEETRERVRQAGEALEQQELSQAISEGTRAEEQLKEMRDEVRRQAAGQFDEQARQMREQARELSQRQQQIADAIGQQQQAPARSLRDSDPQESVEEQVRRQRQQLEELMEDMQETVEAAEESEPLLAKNLYDSYRQARQSRIEENLQETEKWLGGGFLDEARPAEEAARQGIEELREGVERAAESVLGDPTEALRRAQEELEGLAEDLDRELQQQREGQPQQGQPQQGRPQQGQPQEGQPQQGEPQQGRPQQGQPQEGQPQQGEPQQGQPQQGQPQQGQPQEGQGQEGQPQPQEGQPQQGQPQQGQPQQGQPQQGQPQQGQPQEGQPQEGQSQEGQPQTQQGQPQQGQPQQGQPQQGQPQGGGQEQLGGIERMRTTNDWSGGPITGDGYRDWTDRMRDVEEMVEDPELRSEAARIRDRVRNLRMEMKRHSKKPDWELVESMVAQPLEELRNRVAEELRRRGGEDQLAPLDRDPVPERFEDRVRRYYERLGSGR